MGAVESKANGTTAVKQPSQEFKPSDNDFQLVFEAIKELEYTLINHFGSSGDSLHEMLATTNQKLPLELVVDMRELAVIRNNMAHEYSIDTVHDREGFIATYQKCVSRLSEEISQRKDDEETFYNEIVQKHRQLHPRPILLMEEDETIVAPIQPAPYSCVSCF